MLEGRSEEGGRVKRGGKKHYRRSFVALGDAQSG